jgi:hypothetical protein
MHTFNAILSAIPKVRWSGLLSAFISKISCQQLVKEAYFPNHKLAYSRVLGHVQLHVLPLCQRWVTDAMDRFRKRGQFATKVPSVAINQTEMNRDLFTGRNRVGRHSK